MPDGVSAMGTPKMLQALGIALVLCYVAVSRARAEHGNLSKSKRARRAAKDLKRKRPSAEVVCEGLVDLIREEDSPPESEASGPEMTRKELAQGLLVVVVIGPASTKVHQVSELFVLLWRVNSGSDSCYLFFCFGRAGGASPYRRRDTIFT